MTRTRWGFLAAAVLVALVVTVPASAHHKPGHGGPTTTVAPTTTTVAPTTTTVGPTTTTVAGCAPGTPITITAGGTYSGCYVSTNPSVPAVTLNTTTPVTLSRATIRHAGRGIDDTSTSGVNLTVVDTTLLALNNGGTFSQRAVWLDSATSFTFEHNTLADGHGIFLSQGTPTVVVRYNDATNIGRYPHPTVNGNCCIQFLQLSDLTAPGADVGWNRVTNIYGLSDMDGDTFNQWSSSGTSTAPMLIHHNLFDGAFPRSGNGAGYAGGGAIAGDQTVGTEGSDYVHITDNRVVNNANYGVAISGGNHNRLSNNRVVVDSTADGSTLVMSDFANAAVNWCWQSGGGCDQGSDNDVSGNVLGLERRDGSRQDGWFPTCSTDTTSSCGTPGTPTENKPFSPTDITPAHEQAERDAWAAAATAAGHVIGPRP